MAEVIGEEHPRKRIKLDGLAEHGQKPISHLSDDEEQVRREINAGITHYVNPDVPGFSGTLKQR